MDREYIIRGLKHQAWRRSTLELDLMLEAVVQGLPWDELSRSELQDLGLIFQLDDQVLQKALLTGATAPAGVSGAMWKIVINTLSSNPGSRAGNSPIIG